MRLTNVAQMDLVPGRVFSYGVDVSSPFGRELPISFDQGRHVRAGERPGSWMAIAVRLPSVDVTHDDVSAAWDAVVARHGTLRTVFTQDVEADRLTLHEVEVTPGAWREHPAEDGRRTREVVRDVFDSDCTPFSQPSHRVCFVVPNETAVDRRPDLVIGADHAHVDMWSLVIVARELLTCLDDSRAGRDLGGGLLAAKPFSEHTLALEAMPTAPPDVQRRWDHLLQAGGGTLPEFPLPLGQLDPVPAEVVEVRDILDSAGVERLTELAREGGVRLIGLGVSVLTEVTDRLAGQPLRAVFPVHSRYDAQWKEAVGWFITNAVIESADPDPRACIRSVEDAVSLGSWPLAPVFAPYGGLPPQPGLFAVSWLDARRIPVPADQATDVRYVSAAVHTDGVMIWFAVDEHGLHVRCRYPDTPEARANVGRWLGAVELGLRELAARGITA